MRQGAGRGGGRKRWCLLEYGIGNHCVGRVSHIPGIRFFEMMRHWKIVQAITMPAALVQARRKTLIYV